MALPNSAEALLYSAEIVLRHTKRSSPKGRRAALPGTAVARTAQQEVRPQAIQWTAVQSP